MTVGLVLASHSRDLADGLAQLAAQMAAGVAIVDAGGTDDGGIGTSFERIAEAVAEADSGDGVVVLCDLGSAVMTAELVVETLDDEARLRVRLVDAPFVEGAVVAAVEAAQGSSLDVVARAAEDAWRAGVPAADGADPAPGAGGAVDAPVEAPARAEPAPNGPRATVVLSNPEGLHARPASLLVKTAAAFDAATTVNGADARSLLGVMALGARQGSALEIASSGPDAERAVSALVELIESGFGE